MSEDLSIEFGPVEELVWSGMARCGPVDAIWRLRVRIDGAYVPPMDEFHIDGDYNVVLPPYNLLKSSAEFVLSDDQTADYFTGSIEATPNDRSVKFRRHGSTIDICLTSSKREFERTVSERAFADGLVESGREYLTLTRDEVIPAALEQTDLSEPEAEMYHEDLDELEALLDDLEGSLDAIETNER